MPKGRHMICTDGIFLILLGIESLDLGLQDYGMLMQFSQKRQILTTHPGMIAPLEGCAEECII